MSAYDALPTPPAPYELVRALVAVLSADAEFTASLGGANVYAQRQPTPKERPARLAVLRVALPPGGLRESDSRAVRVPLQLMTETKPGATPDVDGLHAALHARALFLLAGQGGPDKPLELAHGAVVSEPVKRVAAPAAVAYDADDEADYATAEYRAVLEPSPVLA